jgi:hypothetical protein
VACRFRIESFTLRAQIVHFLGLSITAKEMTSLYKIAKYCRDSVLEEGLANGGTAIAEPTHGSYWFLCRFIPARSRTGFESERFSRSEAQIRSEQRSWCTAVIGLPNLLPAENGHPLTAAPPVSGGSPTTNG